VGKRRGKGSSSRSKKKEHSFLRKKEILTGRGREGKERGKIPLIIPQEKGKG